MKKPLLRYNDKNLYLVIANYISNGRLYLGLEDRDGNLYSDITVNLVAFPEYGKNNIFICDDLPKDLVNKLRDKSIIEETIDTIYYDYNKYDVVAVNESKLKKYNSKSYNRYKKYYEDFLKKNTEVNLEEGEKTNEFEK